MLPPVGALVEPVESEDGVEVLPVSPYNSLPKPEAEEEGKELLSDPPLLDGKLESLGPPVEPPKPLSEGPELKPSVGMELESLRPPEEEPPRLSEGMPLEVSEGILLLRLSEGMLLLRLSELEGKSEERLSVGLVALALSVAFKPLVSLEEGPPNVALLKSVVFLVINSHQLCGYHSGAKYDLRVELRGIDDTHAEAARRSAIVGEVNRALYKAVVWASEVCFRNVNRGTQSFACGRVLS